MARREKVILTTGVFDLIHPGHIKLLEWCKKIGGSNSKLVVVVARDETVRNMKRRKPVLTERQRLEVVRSLKPVDVAVLGYKPFSFEKIINRFKPDIVVFGYDQRKIMDAFKRFCNERSVKIKVVKGRKYKTHGINSSSDIIKKILKERNRL